MAAGYFLQLKNVTSSTVSNSAYISRCRIKDETLNRTFDYSKKHDLVYEHICLPADCPKEWNDKYTLWNENEKVETNAKTKRHGKSFIIATPQELSEENAEKCVRDFQDYLASLGYASQSAIHEPYSKRSSDKIEKNRHVHILVTGRQIKNGKFVRVKEIKSFANDFSVDEKGHITPFINPRKPDAKDHKYKRIPTLDSEKKKAYEESHPDTDWKTLIPDLMKKISFGESPDASEEVKKAAEEATETLHSIQKGRIRKGKGTEWLWEHVNTQDNPLGLKQTVEDCRLKWSELCNRYLSQDKQIDHRSYERQGVVKVAQRHEGIGTHKDIDDRKKYNEEAAEINKKLEQLQSQSRFYRKKGDTVTNEFKESTEQSAMDRGLGRGLSESGQHQLRSDSSDQRAEADDRITTERDRQSESRESIIRRRFDGVRRKYEESGQGIRERRSRIHIRITWIFKRPLSIIGQVDELLDWLNRKIDEIARLVVSDDDMSKSNILPKPKSNVHPQSVNVKPADPIDDKPQPQKKSFASVSKNKQATPTAKTDDGRSNKPKRTIRRGKPLEEGNRLIIKVGDDKLTAKVYTLETVYGVYRVDFCLNREPLDTVVVLKSSTMYDAIMSSEKVQTELSRLRSLQKAAESNQGINDSQGAKKPSERLYEPQNGDSENDRPSLLENLKKKQTEADKYNAERDKEQLPRRNRRPHL